MVELRRAASAALLAALAAGCTTAAGPPRAAEPELRAAALAAAPQATLELVARMLEQGLYHAALAHLEALPAEQAGLPAAALLRAECLRRLQRGAEAARAFRALVESPVAADARRGLGLLAASRGDLAEAIDWLEGARVARPTDARIRNDLGYALLLHGRFARAEEQLRTALDLGLGERAASNLVLLFLVRGDETRARALALRSGLPAGRLTHLRERATALRAARLEPWDDGGDAS
jgi:Flp pilus assembly protein TadD